MPDVTTEEHEDYDEPSDCDSLSDDELKKGFVLSVSQIKNNYEFDLLGY